MTAWNLLIYAAKQNKNMNNNLINNAQNKVIFKHKLLNIDGIAPLCSLIGIDKTKYLVQNNLTGSIFWVNKEKIHIL